jgi:hypothetical protein
VHCINGMVISSSPVSNSFSFVSIVNLVQHSVTNCKEYLLILYGSENDGASFSLRLCVGG